MNSTKPPHCDIKVQVQLAKLLAKENIRVIVGDYQTAFFNVEDRILGLPTWNTDLKSLSDLLVGHEVGHALHTPNEWSKLLEDQLGHDMNPVIFNIVEDVRIERLILESFPGLISSFREGYQHLFTKNFFGIQDKNPMDLPFLDRLNIKAKGRDLVEMPFTDVEYGLYQKCLQTVTFDDVIAVCKEIIAYLKEEPQTNQDESQDSDDEISDDTSPQLPSNNVSSKKDSEENSDETKPTQFRSEESGSDSTACGAGQNNGKQQPQNDTPNKGGFESKSMDDLQENIRSLQTNYGGYQHVELPTDETIRSGIIPMKTVFEYRKHNISTYTSIMTDPVKNQSWLDFKKSTKSNAQILAKEFERRKAAHQYSKARISRTGKLDVNKLTRYKFDDQIFRSTMTLANAKSHGMIMILDFSGSMETAISQVIKQTLQNCAFCKMVNIPFKVYGFTSGISGYYKKRVHMYAEVDMSNVKIFELLTSDLGKREYETACKELYMSYCTSRYTNLFYSEVETKSGTPLFQTIIASKTIINDFKKAHALEKVNVVFLTDGDSAGIYVNDATHKWNAKKFSKWGGKSCNLYDFSGSGGSYNAIYSDLIRGLKKETGASVICFYVPTGGDKYFKSACAGAIMTSNVFKDRFKIIKPNDTWFTAFEAIKKSNILKKLTKDNIIFIEDGYGYDGYFVFKRTKDIEIDDSEFEFNENTEFDVSKASDRNRIAREYSKFQSKRRSSRSFLNKFAEMVA